MRHKEDNNVASIQKCWCEQKRDWDYVQLSVAKQGRSLSYDAYNAEGDCLILFTFFFLFFLGKDHLKLDFCR